MRHIFISDFKAKWIKVSLLTGCNDVAYQLALVAGLSRQEVEIEFVGDPEMRAAASFANVRYLDLRGDHASGSPFAEKIVRILRYYWKLMLYAYCTKCELFHIQWLNRFTLIDRTILNLYYKSLGKKLIFTAHNINAAQRDGRDGRINRISLSIMYSCMDRIIVHTKKMKQELMTQFRVPERKIAVIKHGIYDSVPSTPLTCRDARVLLKISQNARVVLFFGHILPYKGLEYLIEAIKIRILSGDDIYLLIGGSGEGAAVYWTQLEKRIGELGLNERIIKHIRFIKEEEIEVFFKAADVCALPYITIFQSGIIFLAFNFGLPVIASDVGSLSEDVTKEFGFMCQPRNATDLAQKLDDYFHSRLFENLPATRTAIRERASEIYSWENIGRQTYELYCRCLHDKN